MVSFDDLDVEGHDGGDRSVRRVIHSVVGVIPVGSARFERDPKHLFTYNNVLVSARFEIPRIKHVCIRSDETVR